VAGNWQSCATPPSATPGYVNSQNRQTGTGGDGFTATPTAFSPNADGYQDITQLEATGLPPGTQARASVFDVSGNLIARLTTQTTTGPTFTAYWDGRTDAGIFAGAGLYVVLAEFYHPSQSFAPRKVVVGVQAN
jgi:hypothetical protein